ncbi:MAG: HEAT repeat domain-containing protein [Sedimentisphaerales bacterium]|nr:HEAT repeat domain-containing protein [Sedimentisphaerales bacterium]
MTVKNLLAFYRLNSKHFKTFLHSVVVLFLVIHSAKAIEAQTNSTLLTDLNSVTQNNAAKGQINDSFEKNLILLEDKRESIQLRHRILATLEKEARQKDIIKRRTLLAECTVLAKKKDEPAELSAHAVNVMANMALIMHEKGEISREEAIKEKTFLINTAVDNKQDMHLRCSAIKAIEVLKIAEALPAMELLVSDPNNFDIPEIARSASLSLTRLSGKQAFPYIHELLKQTTNPHIFGTAAYCLGQMKTAEAMVALVQNSERFIDTGACDFTLVDMEEVISDTLKQPASPDVIYAIRATKHLWKEEQKGRYMPLLYNLVAKASEPTKKEAVRRLISLAEQMQYEKEKKELSRILSAIQDVPEMKDYSEEIQKRLSAKILTPQVSSIKTPATQK